MTPWFPSQETLPKDVFRSCERASNGTEAVFCRRAPQLVKLGETDTEALSEQCCA